VTLRLASALLIALLHASAAGASGSYVRPASHRVGLDDYGKYELGRNVSQGRIALPSPEREFVQPQAQVLEALASQLPRSARARIDLAAMAGRLSAQQLDAVRYYLKVRYRVR
jgi:hypothetical protein